MSSIALQTTELGDAPKLRLLPSGHSPCSSSTAADRLRSAELHTAAGQPPSLQLVEETPQQEYPVLIAGRDANRRETLLADLAETMPPETAFEQAAEFWEVLVQAPRSSIVILSGELDDVPAESLLAMLAHRHPDLPVVCLDACSSRDGLQAHR